jgi:hypothetical protein
LIVPIDEAHQLAGNLEHAAPDWITERLYTRLGEPEFCPHGSKIGDSNPVPSEIQLEKALTGQVLMVTRIFPETEPVLVFARNIGLHPGQRIQIIQKDTSEMKIQMDDREIQFSAETLPCIWGVLIKDES